MSEAEQTPFPWWKKRWVQNVGLVLIAVIGVYSLICWDVVMRAKESYLEGEKYMAWHKDPERKKSVLEKQLAEDKETLRKLAQKKKINEVEYQEKLDVLIFDMEFQRKESSLKYAYQWYKDTYELFSPPESKWVKRAREKAPQALELWKQELREKKIPFEDYMFE